MSCVIDAGGRRGPRRTGSQQDDSDYSTGRPSAPATLFDFVTSKMPQSSSLGTLSNYFSLFLPVFVFTGSSVYVVHI